MKKLLLSLAAVTFGAVALHAQTRLSLYEEFSGENCGPCAASNPGLWNLLSSGTNPSKVLLIKYQSPIPSAGPIYNAYKTVTQARMGYYNVPFAPYGRLDGTGLGTGTAAPGSPGHVANLTQGDITAAAAVATPFNLSVTHTWSADADSVYASVTINTPAAFASATSNLVLRVALIEHLEYCAPPGTNGETEFHNVVREMYPDAAGTPIKNTWTASETMTIPISGIAPARVNKSNERAVLVVWIQDESNKSILQAAQSTKVDLPLDVALEGCAAPMLACATTSVSLPTSVTLTNPGTTTLTAATIYYKLDNGAYASTNWTGSLAPGANTTVAIPALTVGIGKHVITDSVALPNTVLDVNAANNVNTLNITVRDNSVATLPVTADFENAGAAPANWILLDDGQDGTTWLFRPSAGRNGSNYSMIHYNYAFAPGDVNTTIISGNLPTQGAYALDFYYAYAQYSNENDKLEVVYSTDCGTSWNTIWSAMGSALATAAPTTADYKPAANDWKLKSIDLSGVPTGAMIAFRGTSDYGNNIYIDDVNLRSGAPTGIRNVAAAAQDVKMYPNPAKEATTLQFSLAKAGSVQVNLLDATGRTISVVADATMKAGAQSININTSSLSAGMYQVVIRSEEGTSTQRLSVVK